MDADTLDKLTTAITRGTRHTIIRGDTTYLPSWVIEPTPMKRVLFQFLRYPLAAQETLLARGLDEDMARWVGATITSTFLMASVYYLREQAAIQAGITDPADAKFDEFTTDSEQASKLFFAAFSQAGTLGNVTVLLEKLSAVTGVPTPGNEYADRDVLSAVMGPTFSRIPQLRDILEPFLLEGRLDTKQQMFALKALVFGATLPIVQEYFNAYINENGI